MPKARSRKDERMYEHVKESEKKRNPKRAKEIAARTVNKQRQEEGRTRKPGAGSSARKGNSARGTSRAGGGKARSSPGRSR